jgi:Na+-transporting methylmalonyl-CoA/oxaloacetate decarboxylase gamma subunit
MGFGFLLGAFLSLLFIAFFVSFVEALIRGTRSKFKEAQDEKEGKEVKERLNHYLKTLQNEKSKKDL